MICKWYANEAVTSQLAGATKLSAALISWLDLIGRWPSLHSNQIASNSIKGVELIELNLNQFKLNSTRMAGFTAQLPISLQWMSTHSHTHTHTNYRTRFRQPHNQPLTSCRTPWLIRLRNLKIEPFVGCRTPFPFQRRLTRFRNLEICPRVGCRTSLPFHKVTQSRNGPLSWLPKLVRADWVTQPLGH